MASYIFVSLHDDDLISRFDISQGLPDTRLDFTLPGGPAPLVINPKKTRIFAGMRKSNELACIQIGKDADLSIAAKAMLPSDPCFVGMDREGTHIFTTYYKAGQIAVHRWNENNDAMTETQRISTEKNAHSIWFESTNRYVYVPHTGPNKIYLYNFERHNGTLKAQIPPCFVPEGHLEPRHLCFHPDNNHLYTVNEGSSTVSVYDYDQETGTIKCTQTVSTLPSAGIKGNTTAEIRISPNGNFLYASNRGHDSIACYVVEANSGLVKVTACTPVPAKPRSFDISPDGRFLYAAGQDSGELAAYEIDQNNGSLKEVSRFFIGNCPMWVMAVLL